MPMSFLEIVELSDGSIILRRSEDQEVLLTLDFAPDVKEFLHGQHVDIARSMIELGLRMAGTVMGEGAFEAEEVAAEGPRVLH